jgi:hypothetical protein
MVQHILDEVGTLAAPSVVLTNTDPQVKQLVRMIYKTGQELRNRSIWPELTKEATITLVAGTAVYALPADFERVIFDTHWNASTTWPLYPMSPQEYEMRNRSGLGGLTSHRFIAKGSSATQITIFPTPTALDAGQVVYFLYQSKYWTSSGGVDAEQFAADTATSILPEWLVEMGAKWMFKAENGLDFAEDKKFFYSSIPVATTAKTSSQTLPLAGGTSTRRFISSDNLPEGNFG